VFPKQILRSMRSGSRNLDQRKGDETHRETPSGWYFHQMFFTGGDLCILALISLIITHLLERADIILLFCNCNRNSFPNIFGHLARIDC